MRLERARALASLSFVAAATTACDRGTHSLGLGPEVETPLTPGSGGSGGGGGAMSNGGAGGSSAGGSSAGGGSGAIEDAGMGLTFGTLTRSSGPGTIGNAASYEPAISADGRFVVYTSDATNLVPGDTNGVPDVFLFDRFTTVTTRVSSRRDGAEADGESHRPSISADARRIAFATSAANLGAPPAGRFGIVISDEQSNPATFAYGVTPITPADADADCSSSTVTSDGSIVVFRSSATNLVPDDIDGREDFFSFDVASSALERLVILGDLQELVMDESPPLLSADRSLIAYAASLEGRTRNVYVTDFETGVTETVGIRPDLQLSSGECWAPSLSADGRFIAFLCDGSDVVEGDTNGVTDVFVRDRMLGITERVSVTSEGIEAAGPSSSPVLSADGRRVVFQTLASNILPGTELVGYALALHNRETRMTYRFYAGQYFTGVDAPFENLVLSENGRVLVFTSRATDIFDDDMNGASDVFTHEFADI